jgi:2,3-diketo-5-methylthio-1-phosphopentane phosphatase
MGKEAQTEDAEIIAGPDGRSMGLDEIVVLSDFDGTITPTQTMDFLYQRFAGCGLKYARKWERGEISTAEEIRATFKTVTATRKEMEQALVKIKIDPGFHAFYSFAIEKGYRLAILSDGLEWYIKLILEANGVTGIPIYANRIQFKKQGFRFEFPWQHEDHPLRGVSKAHIARRYRKNGAQIVYIGDGKSDTDVIHSADLVYAKGWLALHCIEQRISAIEFSTWHDLLDKWREP